MNTFDGNAAAPDQDGKLSVTVIGIGNILMKDEGIGVHALRILRERCAFPPNVELVDGGTSGLDLLSYIENRDKVLVMDAVNFGREPGYIGVIENDDVPRKLFEKLSVHHLGLADVLSTAQLMGISPKELCVVGVQPKELGVALDMSPEMWDKIELFLDRVIRKLREWGVSCVLQSPRK
jgi:hydrogenase maturation protease